MSPSVAASPSAQARGQEGGRSCASSSAREQAIWDSEGGHVVSSSVRAIREEGGGPTFSSVQCVFLQSQGITSEGQVVGVRQQREDIGAPSLCHDDTNQDRDNSSLTDLCSPSSLAARLGLIATPQREAYISSLLSNETCSLTFDKVIEPACCSLNFVVTPSMLPQTPTHHPFHHHLPHYNNVQHRNVGKDVSTFNLRRVSEEAANFQKNKLMKTMSMMKMTRLDAII